MPDILTIELCPKADNDFGLHLWGWEQWRKPYQVATCANCGAMRDSEGAFITGQDFASGRAQIAGKALRQEQLASEGSQCNLAQSEAAPETITISLPALRATILAVIDDGCTCDSGEKHPWELDDTTAEELDITNQQRLRFASAVCERLRQLPAQG